ncbi:MAG TPA: DapH/DapD/GlmU-related protein [Burkholderiales bacterium]|nr:DapH/DapD/GlmU-related protein [Burkholderiales bacterium]
MTDLGAAARARAAWQSAAEPRSPAQPMHHTAWWRHIQRDFQRYAATGDSWGTIFLSQGFWASTVYRVSCAAVKGARPAFLRKPLRIFAVLAQKLMEIVTGICIPAQAQIGEGLYIGHYGGIILPRHGRIGHNCSFAQNSTIGVAGTGDNRGAPIIGNRVFIGAHSVVVGKITIGDDAMICAGSIVTRSVPPRAVVMGNPARVVSYDGSFDHVCYPGMSADPDRLASLDAARANGRRKD